MATEHDPRSHCRRSPVLTTPHPLLELLLLIACHGEGFELCTRRHLRPSLATSLLLVAGAAARLPGCAPSCPRRLCVLSAGNTSRRRVRRNCLDIATCDLKDSRRRAACNATRRTRVAECSWRSDGAALDFGPLRSMMATMDSAGRIPFSVLDLSPITLGGDAGRSLKNSLDLAQHAEAWGFRRYWLAAHHSMPGIASAPTSVVICHGASG